MPIYEYTCKRCGNFEVRQGISEEPLKKCLTCGAKVSKLISLSAFHLKGSGWYTTEYGKNGSSKNDSDDAKPTAGEAKDNAASGTSATPSKETATATKESSTKEGSSTT